MTGGGDLRWPDGSGVFLQQDGSRVHTFSFVFVTLETNGPARCYRRVCMRVCVWRCVSVCVCVWRRVCVCVCGLLGG